VIEALDEFIRKSPNCFNSSMGYFGVTGKSRIPTSYESDQNQHLHIDAMEFRRNALHNEFNSWANEERPISRKDFVIGVHKALARTIGQNPLEIKYILIHSHNYDGSHDRALEDFPNLFYVAMVRDPRENWLTSEKVNAFRFRGDTDYPKSRIAWRSFVINSYAHHIYKLYHFSLKVHPSHLRIIDLNRFHELNRQAMISLASCFGIEYQDILLESTILGKLWGGNSADRISISGFDSKKIPYNWPANLPKEDESAISSVLREPIRMLNYPTGSLNKGFISRTPFKSLANRYKVILVETLKSISKRKDYNASKMHRMPLVLAKTIHMLYIIFLQAKIVYVENKQPQNNDLEGRRFDPAVFL